MSFGQEARHDVIGSSAMIHGAQLSVFRRRLIINQSGSMYDLESATMRNLGLGNANFITIHFLLRLHQRCHRADFPGISLHSAEGDFVSGNGSFE